MTTNIIGDFSQVINIIRNYYYYYFLSYYYLYNHDHFLGLVTTISPEAGKHTHTHKTNLITVVNGENLVHTIHCCTLISELTTRSQN